MEQQGELKPRWEVNNQQRKWENTIYSGSKRSGTSGENHAIVILCDLSMSSLPAKLSFFCQFVSALLSVSCADTAAHRAVSWAVGITQVSQTKTPAPISRLLIILKFTLFYWYSSRHCPANTYGSMRLRWDGRAWSKWFLQLGKMCLEMCLQINYDW